MNRMHKCAELLSGLVLGEYVATDVSRDQIRGYQVRMYMDLFCISLLPFYKGEHYFPRCRALTEDHFIQTGQWIDRYCRFVWWKNLASQENLSVHLSTSASASTYSYPNPNLLGPRARHRKSSDKRKPAGPWYSLPAVKYYRRILQPPCPTDIDLSKEHCLTVRCHRPILETHVKHVFGNLAYICVSTRIKHHGVSLT